MFSAWHLQINILVWIVGVSRDTLELHWTDSRSCPICPYHRSYDCTTTCSEGRRGNRLLPLTWRSQRSETWVKVAFQSSKNLPCQSSFFQHIESSYFNVFVFPLPLLHLLGRPYITVCRHVEAEQLPTNCTEGNWCKQLSEIQPSSPTHFTFKLIPETLTYQMDVLVSLL